MGRVPRAYEEAITATSTDWAPWYVVPADHKWVRDVVGVPAAGRRRSRRWTPQYPPPEPGLEGLQIE